MCVCVYMCIYMDAWVFGYMDVSVCTVCDAWLCLSVYGCVDIYGSKSVWMYGCVDMCCYLGMVV